MQRFTTPTWGYKVTDSGTILFYHILLDKVKLDGLFERAPQIAYIKKQQDGTIAISLFSKHDIPTVTQTLIDFFNQQSLDFIDTPKFYYKIPYATRQSLLTWGLSFQGCLALLLTHDKEAGGLIHGEWEYINAPTGGLYFPPFTLFLNEEYAKVIHPVTMQNYEARKTIEKTAAILIRKMYKRISESQQGFEGVALLSMIEEQTSLTKAQITTFLNEKSFQIKTPSQSPFFTGLDDE